MDEELVLLTSYFNLAGGRRQDNADTFRVEPSVASATARDGTAALYVLSESSASGPMGLRARRQVADVILWEYGKRHEEAPIPRIKAAIRSAHEAIATEFDGHVSVGVTVMAVEDDSVFLGQVAPAQVYVLHEGSLHSISARTGSGSAFGHAVGASAGPHISVFRDQIGPNDVVTLCSSWYHQGPDTEELRECFAAGSSEEIAESLLDLAKGHDVRDVTGIVIEAILARDLETQAAEDQAPSFLEQVDTAVQALAGVGRMLWTELRAHPAAAEEANGRREDEATASPTPEVEHSPSRAERRATGRKTDSRTGSTPVSTVTADTPVSGVDGERPTHAQDLDATQVWKPVASDQGATPPVSTPTKVHDQATDEVPIVLSDNRVAPDRGAADRQRQDAATARDEEPALPPLPSPPRTSRRRGAHPAIRQTETAEDEDVREHVAASEIDQVNSRLQNGPDMNDVVPPVQAFPDTSTEPERIYATSRDIQAANRRPRRFGGIAGAARKDPSAGPQIIRPPIGDVALKRPVNRAAPPAVIWVGIAAVFVLAVVAAVLYMNHHHKPPVAVNHYPSFVTQDLSLARAASSPAQQDAYLAKARNNLRLARQHGTLPARYLALSHQIQVTADTLHRVTREAAPLLVSDFGRFPHAAPGEIAVSPGIVLVLDTGRKDVFAIRPQAPSNPELIVGSGDQVSGFTVGTPVHVATYGSTALVLDDHNTLVRDAAGIKTATPLVQATTKQANVAMASMNGDVYLLDPADSQVWRYPYGVSGFNPPADAYFTPTTPNLSHSISLALDGTDMYVLQSDGSVQKFDLQANRQPFTIVRIPKALVKPNLIFTDQGLNFVWIADPPTGRIIQLDKSGNYIRTYRSGTSGMRFDQIKSLAVDPTGKALYVLCGSKLFDFPVAH